MTCYTEPVPTERTSEVSEPLHDEFDRIGVPYRSSQGDLIEAHGATTQGSFAICELPMTVGFVDSQDGALWFKANMRRDLDQPCGVLRGRALDFRMAVSDLTSRFGEPTVSDVDEPGVTPATRASWRVGDKSVVRVTADKVLAADESGPCDVYFSPNVPRAHSERGRTALANYHQVHSSTSGSFGWTEVDGKRLLLHRRGDDGVDLIDPADLRELVLQEAPAGRGAAFSALSYQLPDNAWVTLTSAEPGALAETAKTLADALSVGLRVTRSESA